MKYFNSKVACALAALFGSSAAINATAPVFLHAPEAFHVMHVSANGKWATGVFVDAGGEGEGFLWNLESGTFTILSTEPNTAYEVGNDGTVIGDFTNNNVFENAGGVVEPGFYRNGRWNAVEMPSGMYGGFGYGGSPNGVFTTGNVYDGAKYHGCIWENGKLIRQITAPSHVVLFDVDNQGKGAAGFEMLDNRCCTYWPEEGEAVHFQDSPTYSMSPFNYARRFSPDGKKLLYWGGWITDKELGEYSGTPNDPNFDYNELYLWCIYDTETGERTRIKAPRLDSDLDFFDISNRGTMVGYDGPSGYIYKDGKGMTIDEWAKAENIDFSGFDDFFSGDDYYVGQLPIFRIVSLSEDEKVYAMNYYNKNRQISSMVMKLDQDVANLPPAEVKAQKLEGVPTVELKWMVPVGATSISGYNVYRDGKKLNGFLPITSLNYYDKNLADGTYEYKVATVNTLGVENFADPITVVVNNNKVYPNPLNAFARQKGVNSAYLSWTKPVSNAIHMRYFDVENTDMANFNVYEPLDFEAAVRFDRSQMANYDDYKITTVSFYAMAQHQSWTVNIYTYDSKGNLELYYTQPVTQELKYNQRNDIVLDTPQAIPTKDFLVAIEVVMAYEGASVGAQKDKVTPGYSDLLRKKSDPDFFSTYESSVETNYYLTCLSWSIDIALESENDDKSGLTGYNLYHEGALVGTTTDLNYTFPSLLTGTHTLGVEAVYEGGATSAMATQEVRIVANYPAVAAPEVTVDEANLVTAVWEEPKDNDRQDITYSNGGLYMSLKGVETNGYAIMMASVFPPKMIHGRDGYRVNAFKFYPLTDAIYTFILTENDEIIYELEVDDYVIGQWNTVLVDEDIFVDENSTYALILDIFDPIPDTASVAMSAGAPVPYYSDKYSIDNGETWESCTIEASTNGSWMLSMEIEDTVANNVEVLGYSVVVDGKAINSELTTENTIQHQVKDNGVAQHTMRIDTYYPNVRRSVKGGTTTFTINTTGIEGIQIAEINLVKGDNRLTAQGENIRSIAVHSLSGMLMAFSQSNTVAINNFSTGLYMVTVKTGDTQKTFKIKINR